MNEMLSALTNKLPCRVGPWTQAKVVYSSLQRSDFLTNLPEDIDFVEFYVYDYNMFLSPGKTGYVSCTFYSHHTNLSEIQTVTA